MQDVICLPVFGFRPAHRQVAGKSETAKKLCSLARPQGEAVPETAISVTAV